MHPLADTGRVIAGRYRLLEPVGRGAMGIVWRARDQLLDRDVAIKEVQIAETLTDAERVNAYQRTLREAKTAARLNHPAVVTVYDVAEDEGRPWIVMQLIMAQSLDQVLATSGPLSPRRAAEVGRQLLSALTVAHAAGVLHRDVKPSNVLLGADDRAVLTDFGIATFQGDPRLTQTGMVMGSPGFTAPERIRGGDASPASDLWSLGATLYAAVEGHGPFERRGGAITTMSAIINEDAPDAPTAGALGPVISALLRREPEDRPDTSAAMRMISDVIPLLPARAALGPDGYEPTALSQVPPPPVVQTSRTRSPLARRLRLVRACRRRARRPRSRASRATRRSAARSRRPSPSRPPGTPVMRRPTAGPHRHTAGLRRPPAGLRRPTAGRPRSRRRLISRPGTGLRPSPHPLPPPTSRPSGLAAGREPRRSGQGRHRVPASRRGRRASGGVPACGGRSRW
jgi:serine/threonine protein kinase